jgi:hypothetical protein
MPSLGRDAAAPPIGANIITATYSEEVEVVDISNRENVGDGYKVVKAGFTTKTWEIECHDGAALASQLTSPASGWSVMSVAENISVDGAVTYTVTAKQA